MPQRRRPRRIVLGVAAVVVAVGLLAAGFGMGRETAKTGIRAANPTTTASAAPVAPPASTPAAATVRLDGAYRLEVQPAKQSPDAQLATAHTWWAFRSSCAPTGCAAVGVPLDDNDHTRAASRGGVGIVLDFRDGRWLSRPAKATLSCVAPNGAERMQIATHVLGLRPQPHGNLVGQMVVFVQSNECGKQGAVLQMPTVATRVGEVPPGVTVPDPATVQR